MSFKMSLKMPQTDLDQIIVAIIKKQSASKANKEILLIKKHLEY